jgi:uncharacterized protein
MGIADVRQRIPIPSQLGDFANEPWDTKLVRKAKPYFILQLCAYADMLESVQGHRFERFGFILGGNSTADFQTKDFWNYYQTPRPAIRALAARDGRSRRIRLRPTERVH